ncbi:FitA-like ribbon-helix-helix domain-containing protein [Burkholderia cenocepacia]|uniref:FitA-like ribbon-helix-helix domain-containing protein n=1 Tax=Burkholderia cenocepacia TaxID=95486 RepID=UPI000F5B1DD0|nr:toxin-antitoxin system HicB family antitoxin [Burkholderia cenocepacia]RQU49764.1 toxin-antitoxin system HicB family antitoxin [Burkholderia cenocepacia]RQV32307.1 toxin-antitoxin system HicB family antitoxin [Burkholderia cenocepacia]
MSKFKISAKSGDHQPSQPVTHAEFAAGAAMVQSQVGSRPAKPIRLNLDLDPELHRRLKVRAAEAGISIAELVRGLITREIG